MERSVVPNFLPTDFLRTWSGDAASLAQCAGFSWFASSASIYDVLDTTHPKSTGPFNAAPSNCCNLKCLHVLPYWTVKEIVVVCAMLPDVAVTVTVLVPAGVPGSGGGAALTLLLLTPLHAIMPNIPIVDNTQSRTSIIVSRRRFL